jgi:hypothetical protein
MSKYSQLRAIMGGTEDYNDKTKTGRVLKWYNDSCGLNKPVRDRLAGELLEKLINHGIYYVQRVQVRNARGTASRGTENGIICIDFEDDDKVCVYIDCIPNLP